MNSESPLARFPKPAPQENYRVAVERAVEALRRQTPEQLSWLGAEQHGAIWRLPVLESLLEVDLATGRVATSAGSAVQIAWQVLVLHYLGVIGRPEPQPPAISFADLASGRGYASVYEKRVNRRLCATAGRSRETLHRAAESLSARPAHGGDAAFDFDVFPRLSVRLIWHAPDEEFPPSATILLPANMEAWFCTEDIVVLCESLVARLGGRPF
jgi:hypothetical protein